MSVNQINSVLTEGLDTTFIADNTVVYNDFSSSLTQKDEISNYYNNYSVYVAKQNMIKAKAAGRGIVAPTAYSRYAIYGRYSKTYNDNYHNYSNYSNYSNRYNNSIPYSNYDNYRVYSRYSRYSRYRDYSNYSNYSQTRVTFYWTQNNDNVTKMTGSETGYIAPWAMAVQANNLISLVNTYANASIASVSAGGALTATKYNEIANKISAPTISAGAYITVTHFYNLQTYFNNQNYYQTG